MIGYFDCFSGASGDMILGALIDAGADLEAVRKQVGQIEIGPVTISEHETNRGGLRATHITIEGAGDRPIGTPANIRRLLSESALDPEIQASSIATFELLASAEARVHGQSPENVHFHEMDAVDTIVDIVGAFTAIKNLGLTEVHCSPVATGRGTIEIHGGEIPLPAPAVLELLKGKPLNPRPIDAELLTPTGAAILAHTVTRFGDLPPLTIESVGYGAGSNDFAQAANVLRVITGEPIHKEAQPLDDLLLEATIDDMNPEIYGFVSERLFASGADDVWMIPAIGKRGRPATILSVMAPTRLESAMRDVILSETSTIGMRTIPVRKWALDRSSIEVSVGGQRIRVKVATRDGRIANIAPEYADCEQAARRSDVPLKEIYRRAMLEADAVLRAGGRDDS
jgi:uncharacterized protein (TIGR00299 family) protein